MAEERQDLTERRCGGCSTVRGEQINGVSLICSLLQQKLREQAGMPERP
jgi:hypothetical protein